MKSNALINPDSLKTLERTTMIAGLVVLVSGVALLFSTGISHLQVSDADTKKELAQKEITSLHATLDKSKSIKVNPTNKHELNIVQASLDQIAIENKCQIQEMTSTNDTVPLMTHYKKAGDDKGWKQLGMTGQVVGSLSNVMSFTRALANISVPIELASIEITPTGNQEESKVSAKIVFTILKQEVVR